MIPKEAIEKAIEGGWLQADNIPKMAEFYFRTMSWKSIAVDLLFWECLGKALEWNRRYRCPLCGEVSDMDEWRYSALRFYNLMLTKQSTEAYWKKILKV